MREFTPIGFASFLATLGLEMEHANRHALEYAGQRVQREARRVLGTYDYGWPSLSARTLSMKGANTPGVETGELRDSIQYAVGPESVGIGTNNQKGVWFELGTKKQPPRSFLVGALRHEIRHIVDHTGRMMAATMAGHRIAAAGGLIAGQDVGGQGLTPRQ